VTQLTLKINGAEQVQLGLRNLAAALPEATRQDVHNAMENARRSYRGGEPGGYSVPMVYGQVYQRTGNLGASMYVVDSGLSSTLYSTAIHDGNPYSVQVLGDASGAGQGRDFVGRWPLLAEVVRKWALTLTETILPATLRRLIREQGLGL
jgi:hypothetical protein